MKTTAKDGLMLLFMTLFWYAPAKSNMKTEVFLIFFCQIYQQNHLESLFVVHY